MKHLLFAGTMLAASLGAGMAFAYPVAGLSAHAPKTVVLVDMECGPHRHLGGDGRCHPNGPPPPPPRWHHHMDDDDDAPPPPHHHHRPPPRDDDDE